MKLFVAIVLSVLLFSCSKKVQVAQKVERTYTDSTFIKESIVVDTVEIPADFAFVHIPLDKHPKQNDKGCAVAPIKPFAAMAKSKRANLKISVQGDSLIAECNCAAEKRVILTKNKEIQRLKATTNTEIKTIEKPKPYTPLWVCIAFTSLGIGLCKLYSWLKVILKSFLNPFKR